MRNIILIFSLFVVSLCKAQLKVDSIGQVFIGSESTSDSRLFVGNYPNYFNPLNSYRAVIESTASKGLLLYNDTTKNIKPIILQHNNFITNNPSRYSVGFYSNTDGLGNGPVYSILGVGKGKKKAIGILGYAHNSIPSTAEYAVGILGSSHGYLNLQITEGTYAGYFIGDVRVTGSLYGTVLSPTSTSSGIGQNPELIAAEVSTEDENSITNRLQQVSLLKMHRVNNDGSLAANKKIERRKMTDSDVTGLDDFSKEDTSYDEKEEQGKQTQLSEISYGLAADQLKEVFPELVYEDKEGNFSINYVEMVPLLVQSIRELSAEVTELRHQLGLEKTVNKSKQQTTAIEKTENTKSDKNSTTYDLSGRPIANPQRGIFIKDGKKITVK